MGIKTNELQQIVSPQGADGLLLDSAAAGTGRLTLDQAAQFFGAELVKPANPVGAALENKAELSPEMHRILFRGKNLGASLTAGQKAAIQAGTFDGLFLGDYWEIGGQNWRIADMDYWYNQGDTAFTKHHLVIMPDSILYNAKMNDTNTTEGGYVGSKMRKEKLEQAKTIISSAFGSAVLTHREYLVNAVSNGKPSAIALFDSNVELPNEIMMYGTYIFAPASDGTTIPILHTLGKTQLALMQAVPKFINPNRQTQWLRDVVSAYGFAVANCDGITYLLSASGSYGVRPVFPVG